MTARTAAIATPPASDWVLQNRTPDGSFYFIKDSEFFYGSDFMFSRRGEGSAFCAWWRTLSLALACHVVTDHELAGVPWRFLRCPGYQIGLQ